MKSARYPKPRERNVAATSGAASTDGGGNGWYVSTSGIETNEEGRGSVSNAGE